VLGFFLSRDQIEGSDQPNSLYSALETGYDLYNLMDSLNVLHLHIYPRSSSTSPCAVPNDYLTPLLLFSVEPLQQIGGGKAVTKGF
jgi:hypothetical protein